jgi:hypothetical protein
VKHRQAGAEDSGLIRHAVLPVDKTFGEIPTWAPPKKIGGPQAADWIPDLSN